jgi:endonuclease G
MARWLGTKTRKKASFTISNIAPQSPEMNRNIWRCFEFSIREWAADSGTTFVVVGTVRGTTTISSTKDLKKVHINVPTHYIAMVYREKPSPMAIGVMVPGAAGC